MTPTNWKRLWFCISLLIVAGCSNSSQSNNENNDKGKSLSQMIPDAELKPYLENLTNKPYQLTYEQFSLFGFGGKTYQTFLVN